MERKEQGMKSEIMRAVFCGFVCAVLALTGCERKPGKSLKYYWGDLRKTDPKLILWDERQQIKIGLKTLFGLDVGSGDTIHVTGDKILLVLGSDGVEISRTDLDGNAGCLTVTEDGDRYLGMRDHVQVLAKDGSKKATWESLGEKAVITSIAVGDETVFVADAGNRIVWRFDKTGKRLGQLGKKDKERGIQGFIVPSPYFDLAIGTDDSLWVANVGRCRVENYRENGDLNSFWGIPSSDIKGFSGCCNPSHIALMQDGSFVTSEKGLERVKVYDATGQFVGVVAGPELFKEGTVGLDLAVDSKGRILVLDPEAGVVRVFVKKKG